MKTNLNTVLVGKKVVLVPYRPNHVPKYHEWMLSEQLRTLTASDPLTIEQEYEMQQKWQDDEDKLTFIILSRQSTQFLPSSDPILPEDPRLATLPMVGDVNIFLHGTPPSVEDLSQQDDDDFEAEVEIMIAEPSFRRKGLAIEALQLMLGYATSRPQAFYVESELAASSSTSSEPLDSTPLKIPVERLVIRIGSKNIPSIRLFEKLGFQITKRVDVFDEVEMRYGRLLLHQSIATE